MKDQSMKVPLGKTGPSGSKQTARAKTNLPQRPINTNKKHSVQKV